jgi:hypothetical protein
MPHVFLFWYALAAALLAGALLPTARRPAALAGQLEDLAADLRWHITRWATWGRMAGAVLGGLPDCRCRAAWGVLWGIWWTFRPWRRADQGAGHER